MAGFQASHGARFVPKQVQTTERKSDPQAVGLHQPPTCPECGSAKVWKDGLRSYGNEMIQRWLCRSCGYRFSEQSHINKKENWQTLRYQVCADGKEAKNLEATETRTNEWAAGATPTTADVKGKIVEFLWHLKKEGYSQDTIKTYVHLLNQLAKRGADIFNADSVKQLIAEEVEQKHWGEGRRNNAIKAYTAFLKMQGKTWEKPRRKFKKGLPRPPTPEQVQQLIAGASRKYAPIFKFMSETGAAPIEVSVLTERSFDFERNTVYVEGKKGHMDRIVPISPELAALMKEYLTRYKAFPSSQKTGQKWRKYRNKLAEKLNDKALKGVRLYDLRHYFGTMAYAQVGDILWVKDKMGHSKIETTMIYTKLLAYPIDEEYVCRAAETVEESEKLIEAGFEYVTNVHNVKLFRKRKSFIKGLWSSAKRVVVQ